MGPREENWLNFGGITGLVPCPELFTMILEMIEVSINRLINPVID
jgi:hypothetical protein